MAERDKDLAEKLAGLSAKYSEERQPDEVLRERAREDATQDIVDFVLDKKYGGDAELYSGILAIIEKHAQSIQAEASGHCAHCTCECPKCKESEGGSR